MKQLKRRCSILCMYFVCLFTICNPITVYADDVYSEGDFHYQLDDNCITITEYFGHDSEVTVPYMIAGYPVSKIATGAFVGTTVKKLNLPDTIMTIEKQAIDKDINVLHIDQEKKSAESQKPQDSDRGTNVDKDTTVEKDTTKGKETHEAIKGINEADVNIPELLNTDTTISVDSEKRLVAIDKDNNVTILDNSVTYTLEEQDDGTKKIIDNDNREVVVNADGTVTIPAKQNNEIKNTDNVNQSNETKDQIKTEQGNESKNTIKSKDDNETENTVNAKQNIDNNKTTIVFLVLGAIVVGGVIFWVCKWFRRNRRCHDKEK